MNITEVVFHLRDINSTMTKAWETEFSPYANIKVSCGDIFTGAPAADSIVSPANSFGFMDGGILKTFWLANATKTTSFDK